MMKRRVRRRVVELFVRIVENQPGRLKPVQLLSCSRRLESQFCGNLLDGPARLGVSMQQEQDLQLRHRRNMSTEEFLDRFAYLRGAHAKNPFVP